MPVEAGSRKSRVGFPVLLILLLAVAASAASLGNGFAYDDGIIIVENARVHSLDEWWRLFATSYWPPRFGASLYRPLVSLGFAIQWSLANGAPWVFHVVSVALYAAVCVATFALLAELLPVSAAAAGAALFTVHPVHVEAVANVVGQAELGVALLTVLAVRLYVRSRRMETHLRLPTVSAIASLFAFALLTKEHAIVLPLLLGAAELLVVRDGRPWRARLGSLVPLGVVLVTVAAAYIAIRISVVGGLVGEQPIMAMHGMTRVWTFLRVVPEWFRLFLFPAHLSADYSPPGLPVLTAPGLEIVPGVLLLVGAIGATIAVWRRSPMAAFGLLWTAVSVAPVSNLVAVTGILLAERTLFLASVGVAIAAGAAVQAALDWSARAPRRPPPLAWAAIVGCVAAIALWRSAVRQRIWRDDATLFARTALDAPLSYRAQYLYGQSLFAQGKPAEGERRLRQALRLNPNPDDVDALNFLATKYREVHLCPQALPLYRQAVEHAPLRPDARFGLAWCLLETGDLPGARAEAQRGLTNGGLKGYFVAIIARIDSLSK